MSSDGYDEIREMLKCAIINCDNIPHLGAVGVEIVKVQIEVALEILDRKNSEENLYVRLTEAEIEKHQEIMELWDEENEHDD